ncbi:tail protein [Maribacter phage Molly_5]|nr:tail protein [Maribacter phage Molly_4]QQO98346.1 tail protein [Maribacter phage Molly_5]
MALTNLGKTGLNLREQDLLDRILIGSTDPSGVVSSNIGDLYLVPSIPDLFINMDGITTWKNISSLVELEVDDSTYNTLQKIVDKLKASELAISDIQVSDIADLQDYLDNLSVADIQNLQPALDNKVDKVAGKGLSTNDFTVAYRNEVDSNTSHRSRTDNPHGVSKSQVGLGNVNNTSDLSKPISTLQQAAFTAKVDKVTGKELSDNNYTDEDKSTVINASSHMDAENNPHGVTDTQLGLGTGHFRPPVSDLTELAALLEEELLNNERRYVTSENIDYFFSTTATSGDVSPDDQTLGTGFWTKATAGVEDVYTKAESDAKYAEIGDSFTKSESDAKYSLTSHTHLIADITDFTDNSTDWDTAFGWGNHNSQGYVVVGVASTENNLVLWDASGKITDAVGLSWSASSLSVTGAISATGAGVFGNVQVLDVPYDESSWNGALTVPTMNAIRDWIVGFSVSDINATGTASASTYLRGDGVWATVTASAAWGAISGTLTDQTDLVAKFGEYLPLSGGTVTGNLFAPSFRVQGTGTGISNTGVLAVYESDGTTRQGYIGFGSGSSSDFIWYNDVGTNYLRLLDDGGANGLFYNYSGGSGAVYHTGNSSGLVNTGSATQTKTGGLAAQTLTTTNSGDGATLLTFSTERPWRFVQIGTGSGAVLGLQDLNGSKSFNITDPSGNRNHSFASSGNYDLTGDIKMSKEKPILTLHSTKNGNWVEGETLSEIIFYGADGSSNGANDRGAIKLSSYDVFGIRFNMDFYTSSNADPELAMRIGYDKNVTIVGDLTVSGDNIIMDDVNNRVKYAVWNTSGTFGIGMGASYTYGGLNDFAMTFQMNSSSTRGWWWGTDSHSNAQGSMSLTTTGVLTVASSVTATNFILSSDKRLKKNIKTLRGDDLDLRWVQFNRIDDGSFQLGLIAQEVEKTNPEFVLTDKTGFKSVKYIDVLIAKMAEKDRKDRDKDAKIKSLETRVSKLEKFLNLN